MTPVFADSLYFIALMSAQDVWHKAAVRWNRQNVRPIVTTEFVLVEVANGLCVIRRRAAFGHLLAGIRAEPSITVLPATTELFRLGTQLYLDRPDKEWSLTDCISFLVMTNQGIGEALTADHHFTQAGFALLLK